MAIIDLFNKILGVSNLLLLIFIQLSNRKFQKQINDMNIQTQKQLNDSWIGIKYSNYVVQSKSSYANDTSELMLNFSLFFKHRRQRL